MPIVNFVREHIRFMEYAADEKLTASERLLWFALMHIMNQRAQGKVWPDDFIRIANDRLLTYCPMKIDTLAKARNGLKQRGLMEFEKGDRNKKSPAYRMIYFFPDVSSPDTDDADQSNTEISYNTGYNMGGNAGDNIGGNTGDNTGGNMGNIYINQTRSIPIPSVNSVEEEELNHVNTHMGQTRMRDGSDKLSELYPPRKRPLTTEEQHVYFFIKDTLADNEYICEMYGFAGRRIIRRIVDSDTYKLALIEYAIKKTCERHRKYALDNPAAYTVKLLDDWNDQGFSTIEDVQEAKDDYYHYG